MKNKQDKPAAPETPLCSRCINIMKDAGVKVVEITGRNAKVDCSNCGRHSWGCSCRIEKKG